MPTQNNDYFNEQVYINTALMLKAYSELFAGLENGLDTETLDYFSNQYSTYSRLDVAINELITAYGELWVSVQEEISTDEFFKLREQIRNVTEVVTNYLACEDVLSDMQFDHMPFGDYLSMVDDLLQFSFVKQAKSNETDFIAECQEGRISPYICAENLISQRGGSIDIKTR